MKAIQPMLRILALLCGALCFVGQTSAADSGIPSSVEKGLKLLKTAGTAPAFEAWYAGGILAESVRARDEALRLKSILTSLQGYRSFEVVAAKDIGTNSKLLYLALTFERGMLYGSFLVWKSDRDWIVQRTEFNTRPELVMPWLGFGSNATEN